MGGSDHSHALSALRLRISEGRGARANTSLSEDIRAIPRDFLEAERSL